jgi:hypothetical protein
MGMSGILFGVGGLAAVIGVAMIGFGIPVNEFSFGNTLIQSGVTAVVGGMIVVALGVVVVHLQRLADGLTAKSPIRSSRPLDMFDNAGGRPARVPFPPKPKSEMPAHEAFAHEPGDGANHVPADDNASAFAPSLRNPEESPLQVEDEVSLSPQHPAPRAPADLDEAAERETALGRNESELDEHRQEPALDSGWRPAARPAARPGHTAYFDALWPAESKDAKPARDTTARAADADFKPFAPKRFEPKPFEPKSFEPKPFEPQAFEPQAFEPQAFEPQAFEPQAFETQAFEPEFSEPKAFESDFDLSRHAEPTHEPEPEPEAPAAEVAPPRPTVAILKSGVVDGMGYTLYVDGSIEAELPQGTLRFASINELRAHLERKA